MILKYRAFLLIIFFLICITPLACQTANVDEVPKLGEYDITYAAIGKLTKIAQNNDLIIEIFEDQKENIYSGACVKITALSDKKRHYVTGKVKSRKRGSISDKCIIQNYDADSEIKWLREHVLNNRCLLIPIGKNECIKR